MAGVANIAEHRITMKDDRPIKQRYFPKHPAMQRIIDEQVDALLEQGCIEPSHSPHSAPLVLVRKKTGQWRMCVDYRQLNAKSIQNANNSESTEDPDQQKNTSISNKHFRERKTILWNHDRFQHKQNGSVIDNSAQHEFRNNSGQVDFQNKQGQDNDFQLANQVQWFS